MHVIGRKKNDEGREVEMSLRLFEQSPSIYSFRQMIIITREQESVREAGRSHDIRFTLLL